MDGGRPAAPDAGREAGGSGGRAPRPETAWRPAGPQPTSWGWGVALSGIWLVYLWDPLHTALTAEHGWRRLGGVTAVLAFAALYVWGWQGIRLVRQSGRSVDRRHRLRVLGGSAALMALAIATIGEDGLGLTPFVATLVMFLFPPLIASAAVLTLAAVVTLVPLVVPGWESSSGLSLSVLLAGAAMFGVRTLAQRNAELAAAQRENAELAVVNERSRFARDLHDILGHSLTVLAVKAELAGRLIEVDRERAAAEVADIEQLARQALADVRLAVTGYREVSLATELVSARVALDAAGIEAEVPTAVDAVPPERHELFGWAVREGVTNVVRHSGARTCTVRVAPDAVEVLDDGTGPPASATTGLGGDGGGARHNGLAGLAERAAAVGAHVSAGRHDGGGFRLRVGW